MRQTTVALGLTLILLVGAACGDDDDDDSASTTSSTTSTTAASTSTTATTAPPSDLASGPEYETHEGPSGQGCTPGESAHTLEDGWWAGKVKAVEGTRMDFDLVCYFAGEAATKAAHEDGEEATDDYYVRDTNPRTFPETFPSDSTPATCVSDDGQPFTCTAGDILALYSGGDGQTRTVDGRQALGYPIVWVHNSSAGEADYAFVQFSP